MKITKEHVLHVAHLARLEPDEGFIDRLAGQIATILDYVDKLNQIDTHGIVSTSHAIALTSINAFREDNAAAHLDRKKALLNAPETDGENIVVPKVIS